MSPLAWIKLAVVAAALLGAGWLGYEWSARSYRAEIANMRASWALEAANAEADARDDERKRQAAADKIGEQHAKQVADLEARIAVASAAGSKLRNELAAARSRPATDTTPRGPVDDAATLRAILIDLDQVAGVLAERAERCEGQLLGLQNYVDAIAPGVAE